MTATPTSPGRSRTSLPLPQRPLPPRLPWLTFGMTQLMTEATGLILAPWRHLLADNEFALGCPLAATVVDASENDGFRAHVSDLLARWQGTVADIYIKFGASPAVADDHATVLAGRGRGRPHPRPRPPQHRSARYGRTVFRGRSSRRLTALDQGLEDGATWARAHLADRARLGRIGRAHSAAEVVANLDRTFQMPAGVADPVAYWSGFAHGVLRVVRDTAGDPITHP